MKSGREIEEAKGRLSGRIRQSIEKFFDETGLMPSGVDIQIGVYRKGRRPEHHAKKYATMVLDVVISGCESVARKRDVLNMRLSGMTYNKIAKSQGCTKQNIHQICSKYIQPQ